MVEIVSFSLRMAKLRSRTIEYENEFWQADSFDRFTSQRGNKDIPAARVAQAAVGEWRRSTKAGVRDPEALRGRIATAMDSTMRGRSIDVAVDRLRAKIEPDPRFPVYLQTVRNKGWLLRTDNPAGGVNAAS